MKKIVITGGHLTPALALIDELESEKGFGIYFFGRKHSTEESANFSAEYKLLKDKNVHFIELTTGRLQRKFTRFTIPSLLKLPIGFIQSFLNLLIIRPNFIVSFGGYLSTPVVFMGWLLGIDAITCEQATIPGLATKINSLFAKKIFLTWESAKKYFSSPTAGKIQIIGNPTRKSIFKKTAKNLKMQKFISRNGKLIFVTGGNMGAHFLNQQIFKLIPRFDEFLILHQVGTTNYQGDLDRSRKIKAQNYLQVDYLDADNIGAVLNRADLVISRSGANTIWDLALLSKVAILVPLPTSAGGEQAENARILEKAGSAIIIDQENDDEKILFEKINYVFKNFSRLRKKAQEFARNLPKDATSRIISNL